MDDLVEFNLMVWAIVGSVGALVFGCATIYLSFILPKKIEKVCGELGRSPSLDDHRPGLKTMHCARIVLIRREAIRAGLGDIDFRPMFSRFTIAMCYTALLSVVWGAFGLGVWSLWYAATSGDLLSYSGVIFLVGLAILYHDHRVFWSRRRKKSKSLKRGGRGQST